MLFSEFLALKAAGRIKIVAGTATIDRGEVVKIDRDAVVAEIRRLAAELESAKALLVEIS